MDTFFGRKQEISELNDIYNSGRSEFVVVCGRRRIGKTSLIRKCFKNKISFCHTALSPEEYSSAQLAEMQLVAFATSLKNFGANLDYDPKNWLDAFHELRRLVSTFPKNKRCVIFFDEMPWLDTKDSDFMVGLESFWNGFADGMHNIMLVITGSTTTWMKEKLLHNCGGLYGRVTQRFFLEPFTLGECEEYYKSRGISFSRYDQAVLYMATGGIPYYVSCVEKELSVAQNLDQMFFSKYPLLKDEFDRVCASHGFDGEKFKLVMKTLSGNFLGFTRKEIAELSKVPFGGGLSEVLGALEESEFVRSYTFLEGSRREVYYRLTDLFTLFWMHFLYDRTRFKPDYFVSLVGSKKVREWQDIAFKNICFEHREQIAKALGISGIFNRFLPWQFKGDEYYESAQVDMAIDRADNIVCFCEMKFCDGEFEVSEDYDMELRHKQQTFIDHSKSKKGLNMVLITTFGVQNNMYYSNFQHTVILDELF